MMGQNVPCPQCKRPVDAQLDHPTLKDSLLVRCEKCDLWSVVPTKP